MKVVRCLYKGKKTVGIKTERGTHPISLSFEDLLNNAQAIDLKDTPVLDEQEITFLPCIPSGRKIICVGLNYRKHALEAGADIPTHPVLFNKFANTLASHQDLITLPLVAEQYDYEAELGIVVGKELQNVSEEAALGGVFGYCCVNDLSARDLQMRTSQWLLGKNLDGFCPVGPYVVTKDEVPNPNKLQIKTFVNGDMRQNSNTTDMIFHVPEIISYISRYMTLEPGDLILTGTPEGVIAGYEPDKQRWLQSGDEVTIEIEKLGSLTNRFVS